MSLTCITSVQWYTDLDSEESVCRDGKEACAVGLQRIDDVVVDVTACGGQRVPHPHAVGRHLRCMSVDGVVPVVDRRLGRLGVPSPASESAQRRVEPTQRRRPFLAFDAVGRLARVEQLLAQGCGSVVQHGRRLRSHDDRKRRRRHVVGCHTRRWTRTEITSGSHLLCTTTTRSKKSKVKKMIYIAVLSNQDRCRTALQYSPCSLDPCMAAT